MPDPECPECGAQYTRDGDSCSARFDTLLALDHSRQEPWGSRHGQAFAAFALQHPVRHAISLDAAWELLYRIYRLHEAPGAVVAALRRRGGQSGVHPDVPARPLMRASMPSVTIVDLDDFAAAAYPQQLDAWCEAALASWSATFPPV